MSEKSSTIYLDKTIFETQKPRATSPLIFQGCYLFCSTFSVGCNSTAPSSPVSTPCTWACSTAQLLEETLEISRQCLRFALAYQSKTRTANQPLHHDENANKVLPNRHEKFHFDFVIVVASVVVIMAELKKIRKALEFKSIKKHERNLQKHTLLNISSSFKTSSLVLLSISSKWFYGMKWTCRDERKITRNFTQQLISRATYFWLDRSVFYKNQFLYCMV